MSATGRGAQRQAFDFYATPLESVFSFLDNFDNISLSDRILEPSAGNGNIIRALRSRGYTNRIDAVEIRPEEWEQLKDIADEVILDDFFNYEPETL